MRLHEEYAVRKGLNIPIILYESKSSIFLRTKNSPYRWRVFSIDWKHGRNTPGAFYANLAEPNCNNFEGDFFTPVGGRDFEKVEWEEYCEFIMSFARQVKPDWIVVKEKERELALWSMFLQVYDGWIAKNTNSNFHQLVVESIREDNDIYDRSMAFHQAITCLDSQEDIRRLLKYQILPIAKGHSNWLEKLINDC